MAGAVAGRSHDSVALLVASELLQRHREAALVGACAPGLGDALELGQRLVRDVGERLHPERVPGLLDPVDRLADLADRPAFERELRRLDDRLVAEIEAPQAERLERRRQIGADRHRTEPEPARLRERGRLLEEGRHRRRRAHRVAGAQHHPSLDAVAEERGPVVREQVLLVAPQLEERQRVVAVPPHELGDRLANLRVRERAGRRERPEDEPGGRAESGEAEQADREREVPHLVAKVQLARLPCEQRECLVDPRGRADAGRRDRNGCDGDGERSDGERRHPPRRGPKLHGIATNVERVPAPPEQPGAGRRQRRLLDVESLDDVEDGEAAEESERELPGDAAAAAKVEGADEQGDGGRHCEGMEEVHDADRLDLDEHMTAPGGVRGEGREEVHDAQDSGHDRRHGGDSGAGEREGAAHCLITRGRSPSRSSPWR